MKKSGKTFKLFTNLQQDKISIYIDTMNLFNNNHLFNKLFTNLQQDKISIYIDTMNLFITNLFMSHEQKGLIYCLNKIYILIFGKKLCKLYTQVYSIPIGGMCHRQQVTIGGSGSSYIYGYVDSVYKEKMTKEACVQMVTNGEIF